MGGTVDPATGEVVWTMHVPLAAQLAHYRATPPRALTAVRATPCETTWDFDGHGEPVNVVFELTCPCGHTRFTAACGVEDGDIVAPIWIHCAACEAVHEIFDSGKHGYDAELNADEVEEPEYTDDLVSDEVEAPHEIVVRFEYPSDHLGAPDFEWKGREQDLFSWFTVLARDPETKQLAFLFDVECA